jgi:hypothetical protein
MESHHAFHKVQKLHITKTLLEYKDGVVSKWGIDCSDVLSQWPIFKSSKLLVGLGTLLDISVVSRTFAIDAIACNDNFLLMVLFSGMTVESLLKLDKSASLKDEYLRSDNYLYNGLVGAKYQSVKHVQQRRNAKCAGVKRTLDMCNATVSCECGSVTFDYRDGDRICTSCGDCVKDCGDSNACVTDAERLETKKSKRAPYDNVFYMVLHLQRIQAKESGFIPPVVIADVQRQVKKYGKDKLTVADIHQHLSDTGHQKYYINEHRILCIVSKQPPNVIPAVKEDVLVAMFRLVSENWEAIRQGRRKSMLTYTFLLHRFCEIQGWDDLKELFKLPKKTEVHEDIWKDIVKYLNW